MNNCVEFLDVVRTTQHVRSRVDYTQNISVHSWAINPTDMFTPNVSAITWRAYDPIVTFHGFVLRSKHERLRLKRIESRKICVEEYLARMFQDVSDKVAANVHAPVNNAWVKPCPMISNVMTAGFTDTIPTDKLLIPSTM